MTRDTCWDICEVGTIVLVGSAATNLFVAFVLPNEIAAGVLTLLAGVQIMTIGWILK